MRRTLMFALVPVIAGGSYFLLRAGGPAESAAVTTVPIEAQMAAKFDSEKAFEHLRQMVAIGPRPAGSPGIRQTRAYITRQLASFGLKVEEQPFTGATPKGPIEMVNLIVRLPGKRPERILITGHYDTKLFTNIRFVGASDAGSSAAFLIEAARVLKDQPREFTYEFVWFDGEEAVVEWDKDKDSTYGSRHYVAAAQKAGAIKSIKAMILIDMIGDRDLQIKRDSNSTPWLNDIIWAAAKRVGHGGDVRRSRHQRRRRPPAVPGRRRAIGRHHRPRLRGLAPGQRRPAGRLGAQPPGRRRRCPGCAARHRKAADEVTPATPSDAERAEWSPAPVIKVGQL